MESSFYFEKKKTLRLKKLRLQKIPYDPGFSFYECKIIGSFCLLQ